jgi:hypothetical protein
VVECGHCNINAIFIVCGVTIELDDEVVSENITLETVDALVALLRSIRTR